MDQPKDKTELTIMIDPKHKTKYCITPSRCYIKRNCCRSESEVQNDSERIG